jgi:hypothetical protein
MEASGKNGKNRNNENKSVEVYPSPLPIQINDVCFFYTCFFLLNHILNLQFNFLKKPSKCGQSLAVGEIYYHCRHVLYSTNSLIYNGTSSDHYFRNYGYKI